MTKTFSELVPIESTFHDGEIMQWVNARDLHAFLEVKTRFNGWITTRIEEYGFLENQDFMSFAENSVKPQGGRPSKEYSLTLDMAKELAMVERNSKGRQIRRYFIECEKKLRGLNFLKDNNLSWEAKGLLTFITMHPHIAFDSESLSQYSSFRSSKIRSTKSILNELEKHNYLKAFYIIPPPVIKEIDYEN